MGMLVIWLLAAAPASAGPLGEGRVRVTPEDLRRLSELPGVAPGEDPPGPEIRVLLEDGAAERLALAGFAVSDLRADHRRAPPEGYADPETVDQKLRQWAARSDRVGLVNLGTSLEGRPIDAMWIGVPPGEGAVGYRLLGGHHGDEPSSVEVALAVAERLVEGDGPDPAITALLDRATIWIVPNVNPDGWTLGSRLNAAGVDLNRNYDFQWNDGTLRPGPRPFSEPETRAIRAFGTFERPLASLSLHAGAANLGWPWNYTTEPPADRQALALLAQIYAQTCSAPRFWTTQGADWYLTWGDTNDWAYGRYGTLDFTLEVSEIRAPPASELPELVGWHTDAILAFLAQRPNLWGTVTDPEGRPIEATLSLGGAEFLSDPSTGTFYRIAPLGTGVLHVEADGHAPVDLPIDLPPEGLALSAILEEDGLAEPEVSPSVLWRSGEVRLSRPGPLVLSRPDADPIAFDASDGRFSVDPADLAPGWWTIVFPDGEVWPRALLAEAAEQVAIDGWRIDGRVLTVDGGGFAEGARAWAVWGIERVPVPLPVLAVEDRSLRIDLSPVPSDRRVDLGIWTAGGIVGLDDLWDPRRRDPTSEDGPLPAGGCACRSTVGNLPGARRSLPGVGLGWVLIAAAAARRRRT